MSQSRNCPNNLTNHYSFKENAIEEKAVENVKEYFSKGSQRGKGQAWSCKDLVNAIKLASYLSS